jgi:hypothetical protein
MKKKVVQYAIAEPCHESWGAMTPVEQGRFCHSCARPVVDFTRMSDAQVLRFMSTATGSVCGRMTTHQLNRDFTQYDAAAQTRSFSLRALVLGTALTTFSALHTHAQGRIVGKVAPTVKGDIAIEQVSDTLVVDPVVPGDSVFSGIAFDYFTNSGIPMAVVTIYDEAGNELATTLTNENGEFRLPFTAEMQPFSAVFRKEEYEDRICLFADLLTTRGLTVEMNRELQIFMGLVAPEPPVEGPEEKE